MTDLSLRDIRKSYGAVEVLHGIDLEIAAGEFVVFVGPSGCGKSTLLRMIAGLEKITDGTLKIGGRIVNDVSPSKRGIAMVFQSYALYPHMTVYQNMSFGLRMASMPKDQIDVRVRRAAEMLQLTPYLDRFPKALSGGQRQRVAIGRAISRDPKVFLFDEPLSNLDAALRAATRVEIAKLAQSMSGTTMIYVTHDQVEAMTLADRIVVLSAGRIEQIGRPTDLYDRPVNIFVARFIGSPAMNIIPVGIVDAGQKTRVKLDGGPEITLDISTDASEVGKSGHFGVRPEDLKPTDNDDSIFEGSISLVEPLGEVNLVYIDRENHGAPIIAKLPGVLKVRQGENIRVSANIESIHLFDRNGLSYRR